ncbi:hypothetical protein CLFE_047400 (plasmid) [Clostridium felsineum DSM 794]|nr:hypothetical protein CLFE_047400 [Clostridium felsineum DSM 794]
MNIKVFDMKIKEINAVIIICSDNVQNVNIY